MHIDLIGEFQVRDGKGAAVSIAGAKTQGLIAFLALSMGMPPTRDRIINLFWGDRFTDHARQSLRQAVAKLKRIFPDGDSVLLVDHDRISFDSDKVCVDVDQVAQLAAQNDDDATLAAVALLRGPLLEGFFGQQAEFDDWISSERQRVGELASDILERAAAIETARGKVASALEHARRLTKLNPWSDGSQMVLLRLLAQSGDRALALQHFQAYEKTLRAELGIGPGQELLELIAQIKGESFMRLPQAEADGPAKVPVAQSTEGQGRTTMAIVPFAWMASESDHGFLVDGLVEDISTKLSRFSWLTMKAGNSTHGARLTGAEMSELYAEQGIDYLIHGSLRSQGNRFRLTVQLADPKDGRYLWVERFDRSTDDLFSLQDELSDAVVGSLEATLERLAGRSTRTLAIDDMSAWECYHRGLAIQYEFDAATNSEAQRYFRRAIHLDANFALAHARLSYAIVISTIYFEAENVRALLDEALELAQTASRLDPDDAVARFALGRARLARGEYDQSISHLKNAIELNPNLAQAHCGLGDSMAYSGDLDGAMSCFEEAVRVSPNDPYRWAFLSYGATALLFRGDYDDAVKWATEAEALPNAHYWPTAIRASALAHSGRDAEAKVALERLTEMRPGITCDFVKSRLFYLRNPEQVETYVSGLRKAGLD